jgi:hypothetical protein
MVSTPATRRFLRRIRSSRACPARRAPVGGARGLPLWMRGRTCSTPVSTGCARPATDAAGPRAGPVPICIPAGQRPIQAEERTVRRSDDRRGRPARRDPDVRRGATATLTAPSTARQRSADPPGRVGYGVPPSSGDLPGGSSVVAIRPVSGSSASSVMLAGVCGRFRPPLHLRSTAVQAEGGVCRSAVTSFRGRRDAARRRSSWPPRARPPTGGCAPPMSCSRSTS